MSHELLEQKKKNPHGPGVRCLSFMLAACHKAKVTSGMIEVLRVALETEVVPQFNVQILDRGLGLLGDLDDMGLLDDGEPELLAAAR
jgi:hypothetical protein